MRQYWHKYATDDTDAIVWVVDGTDQARVDESRAALRAALESAPLLGRLPLLVLVNKADCADAMDGEASARALGLQLLSQKQHVQRCSGRSGEGIEAGLQWLAGALDE